MILWSSFVHEKRTSALSSPREMVDASKNFKTWNLKRGVRYSKSGIPWPFVDRSIRREFFEGEIDDVFAAKGGGFLASYLATLSFSLSFTMPVHYVTPEWCTRDLSSWVTVKIFVEGLHRRKVMNLVPLWGIWVTRDRFLRIYTHFFFFFTFFPFIGNLGEATRVSWYDSIGDYSYLNMTLYRERIYYISCVECTALNKKRPFIEGK